MEWTTEGGAAPVNGHDAQPHDTQPLPVPPHFPEESVTPPITHAPPPVPAHAAPAPEAAAQPPAGFEHCPSCGTLVAVDQRYCLECGHRRGEPRLPFMDAVVFMDAMNRPPEPPAPPTGRKSKSGGISPNAALIAGVGTLLLALGIGVLIGRSGNHNGTPAAAAPQVVTVAGSGEEAGASASSAKGGTHTSGGASTKGKTKKQIVKQKSAEAESGKGAEEVLHTANGVKMAPATQKIGAKCEKAVAGCNNEGKFDGSFFGEE